MNVYFGVTRTMQAGSTVTRLSPVERVRVVEDDHRALRHWGDRDLSQLAVQVAAEDRTWPVPGEKVS